MLLENRAFFVRGDDGQEYGPVELGELREWVRENRAGLGTVARPDEPQALWQPWQYYPELVALLAEVRGTSLLPAQPTLVVASLGRRALACMLDLILSVALAAPIFLVLGLAYRPDWFVQFFLASLDPRFPAPQLTLHDSIIASLISDTILALYMAGFHAAHGQTPAKALLRVKVVDYLGRKPRFGRAFLRALLLILSFNLNFIPLGYAFFNPQRRTFHDFMAGTYVVKA